MEYDELWLGGSERLGLADDGFWRFNLALDSYRFGPAYHLASQTNSEVKVEKIKEA